MRARIKFDELPAFDAAAYLDSDEAIAAYLTDILQGRSLGGAAVASGLKPGSFLLCADAPVLAATRGVGKPGSARPSPLRRLAFVRALGADDG